MAFDKMERTHGESSGGSVEMKENDSSPLRRTAFRALVQDFSPLWYELDRMRKLHIELQLNSTTGSPGA